MPGYRYKGPDQFFGIPARDLTEDEFEALSPSLRRHVRASDAYAEVVEVDPSKLNRPDLETYAAEHGVTGPYDQYSTKADLLKAIEAQGRESGGGDN